MPEPIVRGYRRRDRAEVLSIVEGSFAGFCLDHNMEKQFGRIAGTTWQERKRSGIAYDLRRNPEHAFVAELDGKVIGFVCTRLYRHHSIGHVANMAVAVEHQGRGIGKALMRRALEHFREEKMEYARVETLEQNYKGRRFYPSFQFKEVGRQVYYLRKL